MSTERWPDQLATARLHVVSGKGGTGKSTLAAALALALAAEGRRTLLVEVEGRQGIAQLFDTPPLPYEETRIAVAPDGGEVRGLAVDAEAALLEYLEMFYNLGLAGRSLRRMGAVEFATTLAPGLRDVLLSGKVKECVGRTVGEGRGRDASRTPLYDAVILDAPPTGRIVKFLDVTKAMGSLARTGPIRTQSEGVVQLLHSDRTVVHLVTQLEDLPVQETLDTVDELTDAGLPIGGVFVNRVRPTRLPATAGSGPGAAGELRQGLEAAGLFLKDDEVDGLLSETREHVDRVGVESVVRARLDEAGLPQIELPELSEGVDLGGLYELAELLREQGVR